MKPTSGNTGIGLASIAAARGYCVVFTMPETMSAERRKLLSVYGAEIVLTSGKDGMRGAIEKADEIAKSTPAASSRHSLRIPQTLPHIMKRPARSLPQQTDGKLDIFVAGIGTGGTITGTARYLKKHLPQVHRRFGTGDFTAHHTGQKRCARLQGIGANFIPKKLRCFRCGRSADRHG